MRLGEHEGLVLVSRHGRDWWAKSWWKSSQSIRLVVRLDCAVRWRSLRRGALPVVRRSLLPRCNTVHVATVCGARVGAHATVASSVGRSSVAGYLVDPASSHMLVSKTKPCMCKYKRLNRETANGSLNQLEFI